MAVCVSSTHALVIIIIIIIIITIDECTAVGSNPVLSQLSRVCWRPVLLNDEDRWQNISAILNKFRQQGFNIKFSIHFGLVWNEMQSFLPTETDARRNHDVNENLQVAVDYSVQN